MTTVSRDFTIDLRRLRVLRELQLRGTVSAAAQALHLTPSAVSQQLSGLAREVGAPLLEKHGRRVRLTGQARLLLEHAAVLNEQLERARADLAAWNAGQLGELTIGALSTGITGIVGPALRRLREERPGIAIRVIETEPPEAFSLLDARELDVVVTADYPDGPARSDPRYHRVDLLVDLLDVVLPEGHPLADPDGVELTSLAGERWISSAEHDPCAQTMRAACAAAGFTPEIYHRSTDWNAIAALVAAGAGVALIPRLAHPLPVRGLAICPPADLPAARVIFAAVRAGAQAEPGTAAVLAVLAETAAARSTASPSSPTRSGLARVP